MKRLTCGTVWAARLVLIGVILLSPIGIAAASVQPAAGDCFDGEQASGAVYRICMPSDEEWNGDLVLFAHGYVSPDEPIAIPEDQLVLPDGTSIPEMITGIGYAFATTSYSKNGLAVKEGIADLRDVVHIFEREYGEPGYVYLTGASEGGLITALSVERYPDVFDGGLAACGPVGDFRSQINYWGDARVLFDYFFPGVLPPGPVSIPSEVIGSWVNQYEPAIREALEADHDATRQLLTVARVPVDPADPFSSGVEALVQLLWYNVFATNGGSDVLGGQPYENIRRIYVGSKDDLHLNYNVERFSADSAAVAEIENTYQASGDLGVPVVTLHTLGDPVVPYWHQPLYRQKVVASGSEALHTNIPVLRYGHCAFTGDEVLAAFAVLVYRVTGVSVLGTDQSLTGAYALAAGQNLVPQSCPAR